MRRCRVGAVAAALPRGRCRGGAVKAALSRRRCRGRAVEATLSRRRCRGNAAILFSRGLKFGSGLKKIDLQLASCANLKFGLHLCAIILKKIFGGRNNRSCNHIFSHLIQTFHGVDQRSQKKLIYSWTSLSWQLRLIGCSQQPRWPCADALRRRDFGLCRRLHSLQRGTPQRPRDVPS
jgi:hypothetical protein